MQADLLTQLVPETADHAQAKMGALPWHPSLPGYRKGKTKILFYGR